MFRPRGHWANREKTLLRRARWSTVGAFAVATCMHWTSGCASTGDSRFDDAIVESEQTLPEMGSGPGSVDSSSVVIAHEDSDAFRPDRLSDEPRTGRNNGSLALVAPKALGSGKHDASIMDLDASLPSDAAPLLVPNGKSSLAMKLDAEELKREDAQRSAVVADNDRLLAEATASLMQKPKAVTTHKRHARQTHAAKKSPRAVKHYAKRSSKSARRHLLAKAHAPVMAPIERWKPATPPLVASTDPKTLPPSPDNSQDRSPAAAAPEKYMAAAGFGVATPTKPVTVDAKKQPKLASAEIGSAFTRHLGLLMMGLGVLVLLCLLLLRKSRRENEPMDW